MKSNILTINKENRTPLVHALQKKLEESDRRIDGLVEINQSLDEQIQLLKDEIAAL